MFGETNLIMGGNTFNLLAKDLFPEFYKTLKIYDTNYDKMLSDSAGIISVCSNLMCFYIFKFVLKGISEPLPIFRLSHSMVMDDSHFYGILRKLLPKKKLTEIETLIGKYEN
jgi:hypothetical protein